MQWQIKNCLMSMFSNLRNGWNIQFKSAHMPVADHIFFLCKDCHDMLDKKHSITIKDIKNKKKALNP